VLIFCAKLLVVANCAETGGNSCSSLGPAPSHMSGAAAEHAAADVAFEHVDVEAASAPASAAAGASAVDVAGS
jgi:hypothetical protein